MTQSKTIRIATRTSALALWQADAVKINLEQHGFDCRIVPIESTGDVLTSQPIYEIGVTGIFTKQLDKALLAREADIAVHSLKDVPTQLAENLMIGAVLERGYFEDVLLVKSKSEFQDPSSKAIVATSSLRRKAQWLSKYPNHEVVPIRGNVQTRLNKFQEQDNLQGIIFAKAGLGRLNLLPDDAITLDWMLPAPAQGIVGIACRQDDKRMVAACKLINHEISYIAGYIERHFLRTLMGGCSVPISALAEVLAEEGEIEFHGAVHALNGQISHSVYTRMALQEWAKMGKESAQKLLEQNGAPQLLRSIQLNKPGYEGSVNESS